VKNEMRRLMGDAPEEDVFGKFVRHLEAGPAAAVGPGARQALNDYKEREAKGQLKPLARGEALAMLKKAKDKLKS